MYCECAGEIIRRHILKTPKSFESLYQTSVGFAESVRKPRLYGEHFKCLQRCTVANSADDSVLRVLETFCGPVELIRILIESCRIDATSARSGVLLQNYV